MVSCRFIPPTRFFQLYFYLAAALGLHGDVDEAKAALAEGLKMNPRLTSIAALHKQFSYWYANPEFTRLAEGTYAAGLRRAGLPEE